MRAIGWIMAALLCGCPAFHDEYPSTSCGADKDCFKAAGEKCDLAARTCVIPPDAAPPPDAPLDAPLPPDAPPPADADLTPDAEAADAALPDVMM